MERWEQVLAGLAKSKQNFPWETYINVSMGDFDEAWRRLVLDRSHVDAWGLTVTMPKDDRHERVQYHLRGIEGDLLGVISFSRVNAKRTSFRVNTTGGNDSLVQLCLFTFIHNYLAERNYDRTLEENIATIESLRGAPKQIETTKEMLPLTDAETEVAKLLAQGLSDDEISEKRVSSPLTVGGQRKAIARKLGISSNKKTIAGQLRGLGY